MICDTKHHSVLEQDKDEFYRAVCWETGVETWALYENFTPAANPTDPKDPANRALVRLDRVCQHDHELIQ